ncbi:hypothetical protein BH10PSE14_BH10PSE14_27460 [soil metagenome]
MTDQTPDKDNPFTAFDRKPFEGLHAPRGGTLIIILLLLVIIIGGGKMYLASEERAAVRTGDDSRCWFTECLRTVANDRARRLRGGY